LTEKEKRGGKRRTRPVKASGRIMEGEGWSRGKRREGKRLPFVYLGTWCPGVRKKTERPARAGTLGREKREGLATLPNLTITEPGKGKRGGKGRAGSSCREKKKGGGEGKEGKETVPGSPLPLSTGGKKKKKGKKGCTPPTKTEKGAEKRGEKNRLPCQSPLLRVDGKGGEEKDPFASTEKKKKGEKKGGVAVT